MKIKIKIPSKSLKALVELNEDEATVAGLKEKVIGYLKEKNKEVDEFVDIKISLNGKDVISESDEETLNKCGIVHGDLIFILEGTKQSPVIEPVVKKMETSPGNASTATSNRSSNNVVAVERPSFICSFSRLEQLFDLYKPETINEGLNVIIHSNMIETGFVCETPEDKLSNTWKSPVITLQYKNNGFNDFACTLVIVTMGDATQIMVSFSGQTSEISCKLDVQKYLMFPSKPEISKYKTYDLSKKIKNELLYPLQVAAHDRLGLPAPWHLAGLPAEIIMHMCSFYFDLKDVISLSKTCKRLNDITEDDNLWHKLYKRHYPKNSMDADNSNWKKKYKEAYIQEKKAKRLEEDFIEHRNSFLDPSHTFVYHPSAFPSRVHGDPDSPYFAGEIPQVPNPFGPIGPRIIHDPNPLGPIGPPPGLGDPFNIRDPFGQSGRSPFHPAFTPSFGRRGGGGAGGFGPRFDFL